MVLYYGSFMICMFGQPGRRCEKLWLLNQYVAISNSVKSFRLGDLIWRKYLKIFCILPLLGCSNLDGKSFSFVFRLCMRWATFRFIGRPKNEFLDVKSDTAEKTKFDESRVKIVLRLQHALMLVKLMALRMSWDLEVLILILLTFFFRNQRVSELWNVKSKMGNTPTSR